jgi:hypothetical protein
LLLADALTILNLAFGTTLKSMSRRLELAVAGLVERFLTRLGEP